MISAVHGLGGIGKTTVARWLVWQPEIEERFPDGCLWITLGNHPLDALTIITDCVSQLDPTLAPKQTEEAARADLASLLQDLSLLFVIDDVWPGNSADVAKALLVASTWTRFVLTTRFAQLAEDPDIRAPNFPLDEMNAAQAAEMLTQNLGRPLGDEEQPYADNLCAVVGGHPLALALAAARIKEGRRWKALLEDLTTEIARLDALEQSEDELIAGSEADNANRKQRSVRASLLLSVRYLSPVGQRIFAWLGILAEDAFISLHIASTLWATTDEKAGNYLRTLRGAGLLSTVSRDTYRIHDLMRDLARELLTSPQTPERPGDLPGIGLTLRDAVGQLLEKYRTKTKDGHWHTLEDDGYIHDNIVRHFEQAGYGSELEKLLWEETAEGRCGWYEARERLGQTAGFLADVRRIWDHADHSFLVASHIEKRCVFLTNQLHCAMVTTSINSISENISPELLSDAVLNGVVSVPAALALALQCPKLEQRVQALLALVSNIPSKQQPDVVAEALNAARGIGARESRASALVAVAEWLVPEDALTVARSIEDPECRAQALASTARRLPPEDGLVVARNIENPKYRGQALAVVADRLPPEDGLVVARNIENPEYRGRALAAVADRLPPEDGLVVARNIENPECRGQALAAVADRLPANDALVVARSIDDAFYRAQALAVVVERLPVAEQPGVIAEALSATRSIDSVERRAQALAALLVFGARLSQKDALEVARAMEDHVVNLGAWALAKPLSRLLPEDALTVARSIEDPECRAQALAAVAERLPIDDALAVARSIDGIRSRNRALMAVTERLPPEDGLLVVRGIENPECRAHALEGVVQRLPALQQPIVWMEELKSARSIDDPRIRRRVLASMLEWLPAAERPFVRIDLLSSAPSIDDGRSRGRIMAKLLERLPAKDALLVARGIDDVGCRVDVLAALAERLSEEDALTATNSSDDVRLRAQGPEAGVKQLAMAERLDFLADRIRAAQRIDDGSSLAEALAAVADRLPAEEQPSALAVALTIARGISGASSRDRALTTLAGRLPLEDARAIALSIVDTRCRDVALMAIAERLPANDALVIARDIGVAAYRAQTLAAVAERMPPESALAVARDIDVAAYRAEAVAAVAERLPAPQQPDVRNEAVSIARSIRSEVARDLALVAVVKRLTVEQAETVARTIDHTGYRSQALAAVADRLPANDALVVARAIDDAFYRAQALAAIVERLPAPQHSIICEEAVKAARDIKVEIARDLALAAMVKRLPVRQAEAVARTIDHTGYRDQALAALAELQQAGPSYEYVKEELVTVLRDGGTRTRSQFLSHLKTYIPWIEALGDLDAVRGLERSIMAVGRWWP